jgi:sulfur-carrier protein adenylyltransferase/sulfurtransferase
MLNKKNSNCKTLITCVKALDSLGFFIKHYLYYTLFMYNELPPLELKKLIEEKKDFLILDVRTKEEFEICNLGGILIPHTEIEQRYDEIPEDKKLISLCHHGVRSKIAIDILKAKGFKDLYNLTGGIDAYAKQADSKIKQY